MIRRLLAAIVLLGVSHTAASADAPRVVVSIKPLYGLVSALLEGLAEPELLLDGAATPHAFTLRPSARRSLERADVVVWIGPSLEGFLVKPLSVVPDRVRSVALMEETPGLTLLPMTEHGDGHGHEHGHSRGHGHSHGHEDHGHGGETYDPHIWLSIANARQMAAYLAEVLAPFVPTRQLLANAGVLDRNLQALDREVDAEMAAVRDRPFIVFHPAYDYFVAAYGLQQVQTMTLSPELGISAKHLARVHAAIDESGAVCAFREPQFSERAVAAVLPTAALRLGVLDPLGAEIPAGVGAYQAVMTLLAESLSDCLKPE